MAAFLHQTALQPPQTTRKQHPAWTHSSTSNLSPTHVAVSKRRRAPLWRLQAGGGSGAIGSSAVTDTESATTTEVPNSPQRRRAERRSSGCGGRRRSSNNRICGGDDDDERPQQVFDRILRRIVFMVGVPMASGVGRLNVYNALETSQGVTVPSSWLPFLTILIAFGTSSLGIDSF
ncbi:hypothetical protein ABZP36_011705 [Zizania latifolia]